ncbi:MAG: single-stranded-DNA-specific exonuclease RecJ [Clostridia bacterium]|nr:single-stranded-DNA-specific exonuclease RecJ [Clostridia bacterium]
MNKKWQIYETNKEKVKELEEKYGINELLATILVNRNIVNEDEIRLFLHPTRNDFHDPFLVKDMDIAVERILKAIKDNQKVTIYGDYDVDGITSITVLKSFLKDVGLEVNSYIPNRLEEGYGLNKEAVKKIVEDGCELMITVDCGISAIEEIDYATKLGIETIVTDHHEPGTELPKALAVIDNKRKDSTYPFRELAGVGVAFKVIQALGTKLGLKEEAYLKYLDIVCLGTISDIVPLVDENRVIAKLGLMLVEQTRNIGLRSIINSSGYKKIDSTTISFGVAPRINACGRMGKAEEALDLFLSSNINTVNELTKKLNEHNSVRQATEKEIYENVIEKIEKENLNDNKVLIVTGENWHHGVIGIVSSKITDMYFKPSILLSFEEDGIGKGSGRSIPGFDLHEALSKCSDKIEKFGGHSMAVGITVRKEDLEDFKQELEKIAIESKIDEIIPIVNIDAKINLSDINKDMVQSLKQLEPYGEANKMPIFAFKNLKIDSIRALSEGKHLKLTLKDNNNIINAIGFNMGYLVDEYRIGDKIDVAGVLEINTFNGVDNLQINMKDIMKSV